jgi:ketosteroid isomerase-like protein
VGKLFTDDCVFEDTSPPDGNRHVGHDAVMAAFRELLAGSPDAHFDDEEVIVAGDRAIIQWRYAWTDGHVRGVDVVRVRDGKIAESLAYVKG